jgi:hypothetical protein
MIQQTLYARLALLIVWGLPLSAVLPKTRFAKIIRMSLKRKREGKVWNTSNYSTHCTLFESLLHVYPGAYPAYMWLKSGVVKDNRSRLMRNSSSR